MKCMTNILVSTITLKFYLLIQYAPLPNIKSGIRSITRQKHQLSVCVENEKPTKTPFSCFCLQPNHFNIFLTMILRNNGVALTH